MYTNDGRLNTHANVIIGRLLDGYSPNGVFTEPRTRIVSMYTDQVPPADLSRGLAEKHGFRIFPTVREALTLGGDDLAVDAVCFVGEHGNYPTQRTRSETLSAVRVDGTDRGSVSTDRQGCARFLR